MQQLLKWIHYVAFPLALGGLVYIIDFLTPLPGIVVHHLPDLCWAFAFMSSMLLLWSGRHLRIVRATMICLVCTAGVLWEYAQHTGTIPGTGDPVDVLCYLAGNALAYFSLSTRNALSVAGLNRLTRRLGTALVPVIFVLTGMATSVGGPYDYIDINIGFDLQTDALIVTNKNRFALQEMHLEMRVDNGYHFWSGETLGGLGIDTVLFTEFTNQAPDSTIIRDSVRVISLSCRVTQGKYGLYVERFD